jgi:type I restriction enzyme S subunit
MTTRLSDYFEIRQERGIEGLPLMSVTMNDGLVPRADLERKTDTSLSAEDHLLVRCGDVAYNMMRMWQGANGVAEQDGLVSPAYVVAKPKPTIDPGFVRHWFKSDRMIYLFWAYSHGLTNDRLRLYGDDFLTIPAKAPPLDEQRRIAAVLDGWDEAIDELVSISFAKRRFFRGWAQKALAGLNAPRKELSEIAHLVKTKVDPSRSQHSSSIELDNLEAGTGVLLGQTDLPADAGTRAEFQAGDVLFGKLRPYLNKYYFAEQAGLASTECWVLRAKTGCDSRFLYLLTQAPAFQAAANIPTGSRMPRADWDIVQNAPLPVPHITIQQRAANAAIGLQREASVFSEQATLLRRQKRGLMQKLLTGEWRVPASIDRLMPGGAEAERLIEAAS